MGREIGTIDGVYGGLFVKEENGGFWWTMENWSGDRWFEIPEALYLQLLAYQATLEVSAEAATA